MADFLAKYGTLDYLAPALGDLSRQMWTQLIQSVSPKTLITLGSLLVQFSVYVLASVPSILCYSFPSLTSRWRLQTPGENAPRLPADYPNWSNFLSVFRLVAFSHFGIFYPLIFTLYYQIPSISSLPMDYESLPPFLTLVFQMVASLVIEDCYHYFMHRGLHHPSIYGKIHKLHHTYTAPFSLCAEYAHPMETAILGFGFFIPCLVFCRHLGWFYLWLAVRTAQACDSHSGYNIWTPFWLIPGYGGALYHDFHHKQFVGNYASSFIWWDWLFGTDKQFKNYLLKSGNVSETVSSGDEKLKQK